MSSSISIPARFEVQRRSLTRQAFLLLVVLIGGFAFFALRIREALWPTLLLFTVVAIGGLGVVTRLARRLRDSNLQRLGDVFLVKLALLIFLLYAGWVPMLDPNSESFGYDPQRYYFNARLLIENHFDPRVLAEQGALNYTGIVFYYAAIFFVLGQNPVIPALVNAFVTLLATAVLVGIGYRIRKERRRDDWWLGLAMIIPEVLWFDALTARETLTMALAVFAILPAAAVMLREPGEGVTFAPVLVSIAALGMLALVRPPVLFPVVAALLLLTFVRRPTFARLAVGLCVLLTGVGLVTIAPAVTSRLGGFSVALEDVVTYVTTQNPDFVAEMTWSGRSIGQLLLPSGPVQAALFVPARLLLYIVAPLPNIRFGMEGLVRGDWSEWQYLAASASAVLYILLIPLAFAALASALRKKDRSTLVFQIPCWLLFVAVAGGNYIIQERYRLVTVPFLWGCIWLGLGAPRRTRLLAYLAWFGVLASATGGYVVYKYVL